jgi:transcriptional regulator with XRE-family HTH domain
MTPQYGRWKDVEHYLRSRAKDLGTTLTEMSEELGWGRSYLNSVASGQFRPSLNRCREISGYFDDDPAVILTLAGYMEPPPEDGDVSAAVASAVRGLSPHLQRLVLELAEFLKTRQAGRTSEIGANQLYVQIPDGRELTVELEGDPSSLDDSILRVTLRAALNATLGREA